MTSRARRRWGANSKMTEYAEDPFIHLHDDGVRISDWRTWENTRANVLSSSLPARGLSSNPKIWSKSAPISEIELCPIYWCWLLAASRKSAEMGFCWLLRKVGHICCPEGVDGILSEFGLFILVQGSLISRPGKFWRSEVSLSIPVSDCGDEGEDWRCFRNSDVHRGWGLRLNSRIKPSSSAILFLRCATSSLSAVLCKLSAYLSWLYVYSTWTNANLWETSSTSYTHVPLYEINESGSVYCNNRGNSTYKAKFYTTAASGPFPFDKVLLVSRYRR